MAVLMLAYSSMGLAQDPTGVTKKETREDVFELSPFGTIHALVPTKQIKSFAIFVSGDGAWNDGVTDMAQLLANEGALVAGVDVVPYLRALNSKSGECAMIADDFVALAQAMRMRYAINDSVRPFVVGYSSGATVAYAVVAQAHTDIFGGALSLGYCTTLEVQRPLCTGRKLALHRSSEGFVLLPTQIDLPWYVLHGSADQACTLKEVTDFSSAISSAQLIALPKVGHGFAVARRWQPQYVAAYKKLTGTTAGKQ